MGAPVARAKRANVVARSRAVRQSLDKVSRTKTNIDLLCRGTVVRCGPARDGDKNAAQSCRKFSLASLEGPLRCRSGDATRITS